MIRRLGLIVAAAFFAGFLAHLVDTVPARATIADPLVFAPGMQVPSEWLNKIFGTNGHVHDGQNKNGHAPKVDINNHTFGNISGTRMMNWKAPFANRSSLPAAGNTLGDCRNVTSDTNTTNNTIWSWNGAAWVKALVMDLTGYQPLITSSTTFMTGDTALVSNDTFYDGPSVSLAAGTYLISVQVITTSGTASTDSVTGRLWDGSTVYAETSQQLGTGNSSGVPIHLPSAKVTLAGTTTVKFSLAAHTGASGITMKATAPFNGTTNKASYITYQKIL